MLVSVQNIYTHHCVLEMVNCQIANRMHVMFISIQMVLCWLSGESHACDVHQYSDGAVLAKWRIACM